MSFAAVFLNFSSNSWVLVSSRVILLRRRFSGTLHFSLVAYISIFIFTRIQTESHELTEFVNFFNQYKCVNFHETPRFFFYTHEYDWNLVFKYLCLCELCISLSFYIHMNRHSIGRASLLWYILYSMLKIIFCVDLYFLLVMGLYYIQCAK